MSTEALNDRRRRAREALHDARVSIRELPAEVDPVEVAIETATRVQITPELVEALDSVMREPFWVGDRARPAIRAVLEAAGFEVES